MPPLDKDDAACEPIMAQTAQALGLTIPQSVLVWATELLQ